MMTIEDLVGTQLKKDRKSRETKRDKEAVDSQLSKLQFKTSRENKQVKEMTKSLDLLQEELLQEQEQNDELEERNKSLLEELQELKGGK